MNKKKDKYVKSIGDMIANEHFGYDSAKQMIKDIQNILEGKPSLIDKIEKKMGKIDLSQNYIKTEDDWGYIDDVEPAFDENGKCTLCGCNDCDNCCHCGCERCGCWC